MTARVFVDTNVLLYARDGTERLKQPVAMSWLARLWTERSGRTSVQVLSEYYTNATRTLKPGLPPEDAWNDVQAFFTWHPQSLDAELLAAARDVERRYRLGWWDSLIVAAAQAQRCTVLLSEDFQRDMDFGGVIVCNPFLAVVREAAAAYRAGPVELVRHPPRGRPKRR
jgi:predicted nucleic acid-binding protein